MPEQLFYRNILFDPFLGHFFEAIYGWPLEKIFTPSPFHPHDGSNVLSTFINQPIFCSEESMKHKRYNPFLG